MVYFAPEPQRSTPPRPGGTEGYFASRSARSCGLCELVIATFYNFNPSWSDGPSPAWSLAHRGDPGSRCEGDRALRSMLGSDVESAEIVEHQVSPDAAEAAAQRPRGDPSSPPMRPALADRRAPVLWHAQSLLREYRAMGTSRPRRSPAGPVEALLLHAASGTLRAHPPGDPGWGTARGPRALHAPRAACSAR